MSKKSQGGCLSTLLNLFRREEVQTENLPYKARQYLFSKAEANFYRVLRTTINEDAIIYPKVRILDLLYIEKGGGRGAYNKISQKHIDFVLCHPETLKPFLAIELNDKSHDADERKGRDAFVLNAFTAAGLPLIFIRASNGYNVNDLRNQIKPYIKEA